MEANLKVEEITVYNRYVSPCALIVGRATSKHQFLAASRLVPQASYIMFESESKALEFRRAALILTTNNYKVTMELICQGITTYKNYWNPSTTRFTVPLKNPFSTCANTKLALRGKQFIVAAFGIPPYISFDRRTFKFGGIDANIMEMLAEKLHFSVRYTISRGGWGVYNNGTWTGLVGMVSVSLILRSLEVVLPRSSPTRGRSSEVVPLRSFL